MARHFAAVSTSIWDNEDFRQLSSDAQRMYLMLISQPLITSVGLVPMAMNRWVKSTKGMTQKALSKALGELSDALFVVIDWDRDEVLVRSFVRNDGGYNNQLRRKAIQREATMVSSRPLAGVLAHELNRLGVQHSIAIAPVDVLSMPLQSPIDTVSKGQGSSYVSSNVAGTLTGNQNREPGTVTEPLESASRPTRIPEPFEVSLHMTDWANEHTPGLDVARVTAKFVDYWRGKSGKDATKQDWVATWRNWLRRDFEDHPPRHGRVSPVDGYEPSTTEKRAGQAFSLAEKYRIEEESEANRTLLEIEP